MSTSEAIPTRTVLPRRLETLTIASPCSAPWEGMAGDERKRFCDACGKHVYNLSSMTHVEAEDLLAAEGITPCVRIARRADGTIVTDDCPVGFERIRRRLARTRVVRAIVAFVGLLGLSGCTDKLRHNTGAPPVSPRTTTDAGPTPHTLPDPPR